jgi:hypothetical protein
MSIDAKVSLTGRKLKSSLNILEDCGRMAMTSPASTRATTPGEVLTVEAFRQDIPKRLDHLRPGDIRFIC